MACWAARWRAACWALVSLGTTSAPTLMLPLCRPRPFLLGLLCLCCWRWRWRWWPSWLAGSHSLVWMPMARQTLSTALSWAVPKLRCHGAQQERAPHECVVSRLWARSGVQR